MRGAAKRPGTQEADPRIIRGRSRKRKGGSRHDAIIAWLKPRNCLVKRVYDPRIAWKDDNAPNTQKAERGAFFEDTPNAQAAPKRMRVTDYENLNA